MRSCGRIDVTKAYRAGSEGVTTVARHASVALALAGEKVSIESTCRINKEKQHKKKMLKGGVIACVSSCGLVVGWTSYTGGEGLGDVYLALADVVALVGARLPLAIFYDNACALRSFCRNAKRAPLGVAGPILAAMKFLLDIWHRKNHTRCLQDPDLARELDPKHEANAALASTYSTEACEQCFAWLDRYLYHFLELGPGAVVAQLRFLVDRKHARVVASC